MKLPPLSPPRPEDETKVQEAFSLSEATPRTAATLRWSDARGAHVEHVTSTKVVVGSAKGNGIVVSDRLVSRLHAELELREDGLWVRDLGSKNGTYVDRILVRAARISNGSSLTVGRTSIEVTYDLNKGIVDELWPEPRFGRLVGRSRQMRSLFSQLANVARLESSVLVLGETGTGKEAVARTIHEASPRASAPFIVVDCGALPETLLDDELFGHVKGAFTGADGARVGAIEAANGGTVFLDEIGELPVAMQPRLLRVLESRTVRRIGESTHRPVNVRFISATHRDLLSQVSAGEFREDLYFRLAVIPVTIAPLMSRPEDIEPLIEHFLSPEAPKPSPDVLRQLEKRPWRGNARELRNFVERALALGSEAALESMPALRSPPVPRDLEAPSTVSGAEPGPSGLPNLGSTHPSRVLSIPPSRGVVSFEQELRTFREAWGTYGEREYLRRLLARHAHNVSAAAREAGVDRTYIHRLTKKHDL